MDSGRGFKAPPDSYGEFAYQTTTLSRRHVSEAVVGLERPFDDLILF
jgi:hypothetical protein